MCALLLGYKQPAKGFGQDMKKGLSLQLIIFFTVLTSVLTVGVIVTWEQVLRPPFYGWVERNYPGPENAAWRWNIQQRSEHFFISMTVDLVVVSILLALVSRQQRRIFERSAELVEANERLAHQEKIAALGRVAAQVAHEVRNPLAGLLLYSLHLKDQVGNILSAGEVQLIDKIINTINQLTNTTEQILNFARPMKLVPHPIEVNRVINDVLQLLKAQISANEIELNLNLSSSNPIGMLDEASIRAALLNLVLNAVQAMTNGGQLSISSSNSRQVIHLLISDTGCGMAEEQIERVFEPFNTTKSRGLGLGMPFAHKIIERHGGTIKVGSRIGEGTNITIELPAAEEQK